ncbi:MAG: hypothetical protein EOO90_08060 [Pedobacter sp.]|nr:MAG: hypothetical protein EOO90_08060 [Pedobacter sp.]
MYRKDLITAEIEKLAQVLARIIGLKIELRLEESELLFDQTLSSSFGIEKAILLHPDNVEFEKWLEKSDLGPEKLNALSDFLFSEIDFEKQPINSAYIAQKLNLVYQTLSDKHQTIHLINLGRQNYIQQFI